MSGEYPQQERERLSNGGGAGAGRKIKAPFYPTSYDFNVGE
jgi:hypothetical protein